MFNNRLDLLCNSTSSRKELSIPESPDVAAGVLVCAVTAGAGAGAGAVVAGGTDVTAAATVPLGGVAGVLAAGTGVAVAVAVAGVAVAVAVAGAAVPPNCFA